MDILNPMTEVQRMVGEQTFLRWANSYRFSFKRRIICGRARSIWKIEPEANRRASVRKSLPASGV